MSEPLDGDDHPDTRKDSSQEPGLDAGLEASHDPGLDVSLDRVGRAVRRAYVAARPEDRARTAAIRAISEGLPVRMAAARLAAGDSSGEESRTRSAPSTPATEALPRLPAPSWQGPRPRPYRRPRRNFARAAAALLLVTGSALAWREWRRRSPQRNPSADSSSPATLPASTSVPVASATAVHDVSFALQLPDASVRAVTLAGDFNGWNAATLPMQRDPADGTWRVRVTLSPGRHAYSYVVDGTRWVIDPLAPRTVEGALGSANVIAVPGAL